MAGNDDINDTAGPPASKRKASSLSEEDRTPKRLKSMEPDLVVVVGGIEFYHYKTVLCTSCPFFDNMLSANMKESKQARVEFPDKDPDEWLQVYEFLTLSPDSKKLDEILQSLIVSWYWDDDVKLLGLLDWFDYFGLDWIMKKFDKMAAAYFHCQNKKAGLYQVYGVWCICKTLSIPLIQKVIKEHFKNQTAHSLWHLTRGGLANEDATMKGLKGYLLDDVCGDEMWQHLLSIVEFPAKMLQQMDRTTIVESPFFVHMLTMASKLMKEEAEDLDFNLEEYIKENESESA